MVLGIGVGVGAENTLRLKVTWYSHVLISHPKIITLWIHSILNMLQ